jgi:hypothetical protein
MDAPANELVLHHAKIENAHREGRAARNEEALDRRTIGRVQREGQSAGAIRREVPRHGVR